MKKIYSDAARAAGMCISCAARPPVEGKKCCQKCLDRNKKNNKAYYKKHKDKIRITITKWRKNHPNENRKIFDRHRQKLRDIIFNHYGKVCKCCGAGYEFLTLDHINGNGGKHRESLFPKGGRGGEPFYRWVIKNNFPDYLQALCWNCNCARHIYGVCPHKATWMNKDTLWTIGFNTLQPNPPSIFVGLTVHPITEFYSTLALGEKLESSLEVSLLQ